jgi:ribonuclease D
MLITTSSQLDKFCREIAGIPHIAVDTEFIRERTYWPQLCLIQIAADSRAAAVDTLSPGIDLSPLFKLMLDQSVLKVFHSSGQDLSVFHSVMRDIPRPFFDTQIAAMVCGFGEQPAYATLVSSLLGEEIDKAPQMTDWSRRPLTERQITYALADVTHLLRLYTILDLRLGESGRREWVADETRLLAEPSNYLAEPSEQWRRIRMRRPSRKSLAVLREVAAWREATAQQRDLPRAWVVKDEPLAEIAATQPRTKEQLERVRGLSARFAEGRDGRSVLAAIEKALSAPPSTWPELPLVSRVPEPSDTMIALLQALLRVRAGEHGVAAALVANRRDLELLALNDTADIPALRGWRRKVFGEDALRLKRGEIAITSRNGEAVAVRMNSASA